MSLKRLREEKVLTQEELAKAIGVSEQAIGYWERGKVLPQPKHIRRLAEFFGKEPAEMRRILEAARKKPPDVELLPACLLDRLKKAS